MARRFFFGTSFNDVYFGHDGSEFIFTGSGNDFVSSRGGNDYIFAGTGNDYINAGSGNDFVIAGSGNDRVYGGSGEDVLFGNSGNDYINGGWGNDRLYGGSGDDRLVGSLGEDSLFGDSGNDALFGGHGEDSLFGGTGSDRLYGNSGDDVLFGESGNDRLVGGSGNDELTGGTGADRLYGQSGDDVFTQTLAEETGAQDYINGGSGIDTLVLNLTAEAFASQEVADDLNALLDKIAAELQSNGESRGRSITLDALNLRIQNVESIRVLIDGVEVDPREAGPDTGEDIDPIAQADFFSLLEDAVLTEDVTTNDTTNPGTTVTLISGVDQGTLVLNADGTFSFDAGEDFDALTQGETANVSFTYELSGGGDATTATATITVTGTNDAPVVSSPLVGAASENGAAVSLDLLAGATDVDSETLSITNIDGIPANSGLTLDGATLTLDPSAGEYEALSQGETLTITVTYDITDGTGGSTSQTATLTVTGTNDAPSVNAALGLSASEDDAATALDLLAGATDVDNGAVLSVQNVQGLVSGLSFDGTTLTVDPTDSAFQSLALGETLELTISYDIADEFGATVSQSALVSLTGTNDAPTLAAALVAAANEDEALVSLDLLSGASDVDAGSVLSIENISALTAGVSLDGTTLILDPSDASFQALALDETQDITVTYDVVDETGAATAQTATFTVTGTNDAPTASAEISAGAIVNTGSLTLDLLDGATDIDGDALSVINISELPNGVSLSGSTLTVDTSDTAFGDLSDGETAVVIVTYSVSDGQGGAIPRTATLTVTGSNSAPIVSAAVTADVTEDSGSQAIDLLAGTMDADGDTLSVLNLSALPAGVTLDGGSTLNIDTNADVFQSLAAGETQVITLTYDITDNSSAPVSQTATITLTGTNDGPNVAAALTAAATEGAASVSVDLLGGASDVDAGTELSLVLPVDLPAGVSITDNTLTLDSSDAAYDSLADGETLDVVVEYSITDGDGGSVAQSVTLTLTGTNDTPIVAAALAASTTEDDAAVTLDLLDGASDVDNGAVLSVENVNGLTAGVTLDGTVLSVDASNTAFQSLALGEAQTITVTYDIVDENGASIAQTTTVTITGTNDAPIVAAALTASADEDGAAVNLDLLDGASDVDNGSVLSVANVSGLSNGVTLDGTILSLDPSNAAFQSLAQDEAVMITVTYDVVDENEASAAQTATFTVTGTNDAPVVVAALTVAAIEGAASVSVDLLGGASDVDAGTELSLVLPVDLPAGVSITDNTLTLDPSDAAYDSLADGETLDVVVEYSITDGDGGSVAQSVTLTLTGTNDTPIVAAALEASTTEDDAVVTLDLLDGASDVDNGAVLSVENVNGLTAGVTLDGAILTVDAADAAFQSLALGETLNIIVTYDVADENGATVAQSAAITVTGTNDTPVVSGVLSAAAAEDDAALTVDLLGGASDIDNNTVLNVANVQGLIAGISLIGTTLTVDPADASFQSLSVGETRDITVSYDIVDEANASVSQTLTVTITGTNDAPVGSAVLNGGATEDAGVSEFDLLDGASDVDTLDALSVTNVAGLVDGVSLDGAALLVDANDASFQALASGETQVITVTYDVIDGNGGSLPRSFDLTVTGTNDAPVVEAALVAAATEDGSGQTLDLLSSASDVDAGTVLTIENIAGLTAGLTLDGTTLTLDPADAAFQSLSAGQTQEIVVSYDISDGLTSAAQTATITVTGTNDAPVVNMTNETVVIAESGLQTIDLLAHVSDVDQLDVLNVINVTDLPQGVTLSSDAPTLLVDTNDASFEALAENETLVLEVFYDAVDGQGGSVATSALITLRGTNNAPVVASAITATLSEDVGQRTFNLLEGASDVDTDAVLAVDLDLADLPDGFSLQSDGQTLVFRPFLNAEAQALTTSETLDFVITYSIVDEFGASVAQNVTITVEGANDAPVSTQNYNIQTIDFDEAYELVLPADQFTDAEGDAITLTAALSNGDPLPAWLTFDAATQTLSGTPTATDGGGVNVFITAEDENGGVTVQNIRFAIGDGLILGTDGDDMLIGTNGADTFIAGTGNDRQEGLGGNDTYIFNSGDGQDTVSEASSFNTTDTIVFTDYNLADATFTDIDQNSYTITFENGDSVTVENGLTNEFTRVEVLEFADQSLSFTQILTTLVDAQSTDGDDLIIGTTFDDVLSGGAGNDRITGLGGNDIYEFSTGDGQDTIAESSSFNTNDTLRFTDYNLADATFSVTDKNTYVVSFENGDSVTVENSVNSAFNRIESIEFADETLDFTGVLAAIAEGQVTDGDDLIIGTDNNDVLTGGLGNDRVEGNGGNDTYVFSRGDGQDTFRENSSFNSTDVVQFTDYALEDATFTLIDTDNYTISFANGDSVTIEAGLVSEFRRIESIEFTDQTLDFTTIRAALVANQATDGDDLIIGTLLADVLRGGLGDDRIEGNGGSDIYEFSQGDGNDTIRENSSNGTTDILRFTDYDLADATFTLIDSDNYVISFSDTDSVTVEAGITSANRRIEVVEFADQTLDFTAIRAELLSSQTTDGDDLITGTAFSDLLQGGLGNDRLEGNAGNDIYEFSSGDGQDTVRENSSNGTTDTIRFTNYDLADATFTVIDADNYVITFANADSVTVEAGISSNNRRIEVIEFADETLDFEMIRTTLLAAQSTDGDDLIIGSAFGDVHQGGTGNDRLEGNGGSDTYLFSAGDGQDTVRENNSFGTTDIIEFTDYNLADATFFQINNDNYIISFESGDSVTVEAGLISSSRRIEQVQFADELLVFADIQAALAANSATDVDDMLMGSVLDDSISGGLGNDIINGGAGNDTLNGNAGADTLIGGRGNDAITGGDDADRIEFASGDGQDTVFGGFGDTDDVLAFTDYDRAEASYARTGDTLTINFANGDSVTIVDAFLTFVDTVASVEFADETISFDTIAQEVLQASQTDGDDTINGYDTNDTIEGGLGNDTIFGGRGDDTYLFDLGDGDDLIFETSGNDTIDFGSLSSADASFFEVQDGIRIEFTSGDSVTVVEPPVFGGGDGDGGPVDTNGVETFNFSDQSLTYDEIVALLFPSTPGEIVDGTDGNDVLFGTDGDDTLTGGLGNDTLRGGDGSDNYIYAVGDGADEIIDTGGMNDTLTLLGFSSLDIFPLFTIDGGVALGLPSDPETETFNDIFLGNSGIETFIFVPDPANPDNFETLTFDELFNDGPFGPIGGPFDGPFDAV